MAKLALILVAIVAALVWLRLAARRPRRAEEGPPPRHVGAMVACARCAVLFPADEAAAGPGGLLYCSVAHRDARDAGA
jgi:uncharacterized protein